MAITPAGYVHQQQLQQEIDAAIRALNPAEVASVRYSIGDDYSGTPAIHFRVVLKDDASRRGRLLDVATRIESSIEDAVQPIERWGLWPHFDYINESERRTVKDPAWA